MLTPPPPLPNAPTESLHACDWWMYTDLLIDREDIDPASIRAARTIAASLHQDGAFLVPVLSIPGRRGTVIVGIEQYLTDNRLHRGLLSSRHVSWVRPRWIPFDSILIDDYWLRATPWGGAPWEPFNVFIAAEMADSRWGPRWVEQFWACHALEDRPEHRVFSPTYGEMVDVLPEFYPPVHNTNGAT